MPENLDIYTSDTFKEEVLTYNGVEIKLQVKPLSWSKKNQILSRCFTYSQNGDVNFNLDRYMKEVICEIIVQAPWGDTNHIFLSRIKPDFGSMLEKLVPKLFDEGKNIDFFAKKSEDSSVAVTPQ